MLKKVFGSAVFGVEATTVTVEVNVDTGIGYHLVGLPDNAIKESNYRIAAALQNNGYKIPGKKIIINMKNLTIKIIKFIILLFKFIILLCFYTQIICCFKTISKNNMIEKLLTILKKII